MKKKFQDINFREDSLERIRLCDRIMKEYKKQGLRLSLRQLYYQLVSKNVISNEEKSYKNLGKLVSNARLAGLLDWDTIEDRIRIPDIPSEWDGIEDLVDSALRSFRLNRLQGQPINMELWVEKDALAGVLQPLAEKYHIPLMVNRGYSSQSAMYQAATRIQQREKDIGASLSLILYLGDLDPSGEDMVRDIQDRLTTFDCEVDVKKVALNIQQVKDLGLPANPAKMTDSRAKTFVKKYGSSSWELDAIEPPTLLRIVEEELKSLINLDRMIQVIKEENEQKEKLRSLTKSED